MRRNVNDACNLGKWFSPQAILVLVWVVLSLALVIPIFRSSQPTPQPQSDTVQQPQSAPKETKIPQSWGVSGGLCILFFINVNFLFCLWAHKSVNSICDDETLSNEMKLKKLKADDVLFDLPLYGGLLGTVVGFILLSSGYSYSRDVAYYSTVFGILVSAGMRLVILRPVQKSLMSSLEMESSDDE